MTFTVTKTSGHLVGEVLGALAGAVVSWLCAYFLWGQSAHFAWMVACVWLAGALCNTVSDIWMGISSVAKERGESPWETIRHYKGSIR